MATIPTTTDEAAPLLDAWGLEDFPRGLRNLSSLAGHLGQHWNAVIGPLGQALPACADPDLALNTLERFFTTSAGKDTVPTLLADDAKQLDMLVQLFGVSQFFGDVLVADPDLLDVGVAPLRDTPTPDELCTQLQTVIANATDEPHVLTAIRLFRRRHLLRIGVNDIIRQRPLEEITADLSRVAEAAVAVVWAYALQKNTQRFGGPTRRDGQPATAAVLAFGKLGGSELNYSSDIDLMIVYSDEGQTTGRRPIGNDDFFARTAADLIRLLSAHTERGFAYRVDFRLRPEGQHGPLARSLAGTLAYYDARGRTWERQALIKVRPIAGDHALGAEFLEAIQPFVYKRFLSVAEINDIKAMKRKIEHKAHREGATREVKTGPGGIRDIEFAIQFLQLLNGGDLLTVRHRDTLSAMQALERVGCLTDTEYRGLDDTYRFLRKLEHRLQLLFDLQQHRLPDDLHELRKLALRMGYTETNPRQTAGVLYKPTPSTLSAQKHSILDEPSLVPSLVTRDLLHDPLDLFLHDYSEKTRLNRTILNFLLHATFTDSDKNAEPESDLILDPDPEPSVVADVLGKHGFRDIPAAWRNLLQLAQEQRFLSTRRCRHFLASIAPQLLRAVGATTDPDLALTNLEKVTATLGGKAVLWELFSFHPPSLTLYVDICDSPFLAQMLINNPGMIDDLLDSLMLNRPRSLTDLRAELTELLRGVTTPDAVEPILHSFQDKEVLRIAVRDLLGKDDIRATTAALSDIAEVLLDEVATRQESLLTARHGAACPHTILALGKLGGREMSYHSDLDLVIIYAEEGRTSGPKPLDHYEYFSEYGRRLIKALSQMGPLGKLYAVDMRLRPTGGSGSLAISLDELRRYHASPQAQVWERQSLTRARIVHGDVGFAKAVQLGIQQAIFGHGCDAAVREEIRAMRARLEATAPPRSLKRCPGGMTDIEFLTQAFQLQCGQANPEVCRTNVWDCLDALLLAGLLDEADHTTLSQGYSFYRRAEARLRIVTNRPLNEYPEAPGELEKLAHRIGYASGQVFLAELATRATAIRAAFQRLV